jgi:hypothetical protein
MNMADAGKKMKCYVITGISGRVIEALMRREIRSVELRSAHNVATAMRAETGDCVLLTPARLCDLGRGTTGIIAEVTGKEVMSHSVFFATGSYFEENEMTAIRLILKPRGFGRIVSVVNSGILETTVADVVSISHFDAG